ncbi:hypothetical protein [Pelagicoccus sp. SDUM812002]|uniref:hypothetical protein n=1 Tax=Pelagicoccus sp. SDUM812002 TaxID=3041266 RepID=UPI00280E87FB|nr:hypothetical protein [Pelagicoccus sp. SDUM812002]MDQ8185625.1 hypothetical protein [Pelagicoccus sp. SDUM812002]
MYLFLENMNLMLLAKLPGGHPSDAITDVLGIVAVCAFFGIACYIAMQVLKDSTGKSLPVSTSMNDFYEEEEKKKSKAEPKIEVNELEELEKHCEKFFLEVVEEGQSKLEEFAQVAEDTFNQVADGYASNSFGHEGEGHAVRSKKFLSVCERQWGALRSDIGYVSYMDIQDHLRHILTNHRMLDGQKHSNNEVADLSPELLRSQELVALMRVVPKDKVRTLQEQLLKAVGSFRDSFQEECKVWINEQVVKLQAEMRPRKSRKVQITDTEYYKKFKQLRVRLEVVARLSDGITENTQQVSENGLALSQVIHVGTVLRILACIPEWFQELELGTHSEVA